MPHLTPNAIDGYCVLSFLVPDSPETIAACMGEIAQLAYKYNWEGFGTLTADETSQLMHICISSIVKNCATLIVDDNGSLIVDDNGRYIIEG
jgi:hypothetical protein